MRRSSPIRCWRARWNLQVQMHACIDSCQSLDTESCDCVGCAAENGVPFGLAEQVSQPETKRRWHQSCRENVLRSTQPGVGAHTRLWIAENERDGTIVGSVGIRPDPGNDKGSDEVIQAVLAHSGSIVGQQRCLKLGELVYARAPVYPMLSSCANALALPRRTVPSDRMCPVQVILCCKTRTWERRRFAVDGYCPDICSKGWIRCVVFVRFPSVNICDSAVHAVRVLRRCTVRTHLNHDMRLLPTV